MWVNNPSDLWWCLPTVNPVTVSVEEARESLVLDQNGDRIKLEKKHPVGFDLRSKHGNRG